MAYLPFYITPEEFSAHQEEQEQEILKGMNLTTWHKHDIEEPFRYLYLSIAIAAVSPLFFLTYFLHDNSDMILTYILSGLTIIMSGVSYLTFGLDNRYDYTLSDRGLVIKKRRNLPNWVNSATQVMGWIGAIVCILMVAFAGPVVLVGAGGFILVSFRMLKRQPNEETEVLVALRENWLCCEYCKNRKVIELYHKHDDCSYQDTAKTTVTRYHSIGSSYLFVSSPKQLEETLNMLNQEFELDCKEVPKAKDLFDLSKLPEIYKTTPFRGTHYPLEAVGTLRTSNAPLPDLEYISSVLAKE